MTKPNFDIIGFSENIYDVYKTGDPVLIMRFLEEHEKVLFFYKLLSITVFKTIENSAPEVPWL